MPTNSYPNFPPVEIQQLKELKALPICTNKLLLNQFPTPSEVWIFDSSENASRRRPQRPTSRWLFPLLSLYLLPFECLFGLLSTWARQRTNRSLNKNQRLPSNTELWQQKMGVKFVCFLRFPGYWISVWQVCIQVSRREPIFTHWMTRIQLRAARLK